MNFDAYIFWQREIDGQHPGPWFQSDVQQEPAPHSPQSAARVLEMIRDNEPRPQDWEFRVMLLDGCSDVTDEVMDAIDESEYVAAVDEELEAMHTKQEAHGWEQV